MKQLCLCHFHLYKQNHDFFINIILNELKGLKCFQILLTIILHVICNCFNELRHRITTNTDAFAVFFLKKMSHADACIRKLY